jgi:hypothetical protein
MPNYLICSTDKDDYGHILVNLCPYFFQPSATVTVQSVNTMANIEILGKDDYITFEMPIGETRYANMSYWSTPEDKTKIYDVPNLPWTGTSFHIADRGEFEWKYQDQFVIFREYEPGSISHMIRYIKLDHIWEEYFDRWLLYYHIDENDAAKRNKEWSNFEQYSYFHGFGIVYEVGSGKNGGTGCRFYPVPELQEGSLLICSQNRQFPWKYEDGWVIYEEVRGIAHLRLELAHEQGGWRLNLYIDVPWPGNADYYTHFERTTYWSCPAKTHEQYKLTGEPRLGCSWDAVPSMMQKRLREDGIGMACQLTEMKKFRFRNLTEVFRISDMSYNYQVLLGFWGRCEFPIESHPRSYWTRYDSPEAPKRAVRSFKMNFPSGTDADNKENPCLVSVGMVYMPKDNINNKDVNWPEACQKPKRVFPSYEVQGGSGYRITWYLKDKVTDKAPFAQVDPNTGAVRILPITWADMPWMGRMATVTGYLYEAGEEMYSHTAQYTICASPWTTEDGREEKKRSNLEVYINAERTTLRFDETCNIMVWHKPYINGGHRLDSNLKVRYWEILPESKKFLRFTGTVNDYGRADDENRNIQVQARQRVM